MLDGFPQAIAAKKKIFKKRGKPHSVFHKKGKAKRLGNVKYPPLRDGLGGDSALAVQTSPRPAPAGLTPVPPTPGQRPGTTLQGKKGTPKSSGKPPPPTDTEILDEAQNAYVRGERQRAIDIALGVAEKHGSTAETAWRFIGLAACSVRSHRMATRAFQNLNSANDQRTITNACKLNGLAYRDEQFNRE